MIQYGFVTLFVAAFPLAPFFALVNNMIEIRIDAYKYIATKRRPLAERAQDIGAWLSIMQAITYLSFVTNVNFLNVFRWEHRDRSMVPFNKHLYVPIFLLTFVS